MLHQLLSSKAAVTVMISVVILSMGLTSSPAAAIKERRDPAAGKSIEQIKESSGDKVTYPSPTSTSSIEGSQQENPYLDKNGELIPYSINAPGQSPNERITAPPAVGGSNAPPQDSLSTQ